MEKWLRQEENNNEEEWQQVISEIADIQ